MTPHPVSVRPMNKLPTRQHCLKVMNKLLNNINAAKDDSNDHYHNDEENAIIFLSGGLDSVRDGTDVEIEFRQLSDFFYLTGVDEPGFHVMIDLQTKLVYLVPPTVPESETVWKGAPDSPSELLRKHDVDRIISEKELAEFIIQQGYHKVHVLDRPTFIMNNSSKNSNSDDNTIICTTTNNNNNNSSSSSNSNSNSNTTFMNSIFRNVHELQFDTHTLRHALNEARLTKFPWEIDAIRQATLVSSRAHMALWQQQQRCRGGQQSLIKATITESQLAAYFRWICACSGLDRQAYIPIVASGPRAAILHYTRNNMPLPIQDPHALVLVDAGAEYRCYGSDITRTFPVTGKFSPEAKTIYNIVLAMQEAVLNKLAPGVMWDDMEDLAVQVLCNELVRIGILVGDQDELIHLGVPYAFYFHSLGHTVGLDVHDVGRSLMMHHPLEPNMIITVEPGLYFNDAYLRIWTEFPGFSKYFNMDLLQRYRPVGGVRIEDSVLITATGCENLTVAPKQTEEIEAIMAAATPPSSSSSSSSSLSLNNDNINDSSCWATNELLPLSSPSLLLPPGYYGGGGEHNNYATKGVRVDDTQTTALPTPTASPLNGSYCF
ncbi:peptidase M24, structural domain-containing protein [Zychaea mexicana]|uniref:peptidase M24, structural domain-containing protein n=1 Tax=Zychaea mexicana TaxID=64656 RepID=UPI0022FF343C|nr:peptidase M24, structural domain-containing protein [Zychaea mexicana]KAI9499427.1 peptidase M24, structural domain-containing protein [Zychaea mexicana]